MPRRALRIFAASLFVALPTAMGQPARAQTPAPAPAPVKPAAAPTANPQAAPAANPQDTAPSKTGTETPALVINGTADALLGKPVRSPKGDDLGRIVDVVVDRSGVIRAAIIDFGGFLGVGSRKVAVDWRELHFPKDGNLDNLVADLPQDQLRIAPLYRAGEPVVVVGKVAAAPPTPKPAAAPAPPAPAPPPVQSTPPPPKKP